MSSEILMPALSPTMEEGKLAKWLVKEGDAVKSGDILAEIETDKATMEFEAVDEGKIGKILVPEGTEGVKVNQPIAVLLQDGEAAAPVAKAKTESVAKAPADPPLKGEGRTGEAGSGGVRPQSRRRPPPGALRAPTSPLQGEECPNPMFPRGRNSSP